MQGIIDFHTHAFPDELAGRAMQMLEDEGGIKAHLDGRISSLLDSMDRSGIGTSIVCSIATRPSQFEPILEWSKKVRSERIIPFPSIHPEDRDYADRIQQIKAEGFKGIKFHPYYQNFNMDEERIFPIYEKIAKENLILVVHTGFDFAFEKIRRADPEKIVRVIETFPELRIVTTHLGAWDDWDEVRRHLLGKQIYMEISFSLEYIEKEAAREFVLKHPSTHILFGTDSPWTDQGKTMALLRNLDLGSERETLIFRDNALDLLNTI